MAQKHITELIDDLDGTTATHTINFALDGKSYAIDLNDTNAAQLRDIFSTYANAARTSDTNAAKPKPATNKRTDLNEIRAWAKQNGHTIADRGRIALDIQNAYDAAH